MKRYKKVLSTKKEGPLLDYAKRNRDLIYYDIIESEAVFSPMNNIEGDTPIAVKLNKYGEFSFGGMESNVFEPMRESGRILLAETRWLRDMLDFIERGKKSYTTKEEEAKLKKELEKERNKEIQVEIAAMAETRSNFHEINNPFREDSVEE